MTFASSALLASRLIIRPSVIVESALTVSFREEGSGSSSLVEICPKVSNVNGKIALKAFLNLWSSSADGWSPLAAFLAVSAIVCTSSATESLFLNLNAILVID